ncbi:hypothetical protein [Winogradskyella sp. A3E31]|uniref:hypothetical protein n=1 Tax=Winogradskyella sp. A3E31 TaxID=3349637 RepID=UPI00398A7A56
MKFEDSPFFGSIKYSVLRLDFGIYYLCDTFIVGELNEGIHFDEAKAKIIGKEIIKFYGKRPKICLISNRVNSYSVDPQNWVRVMEMYPDILRGSCIISYNQLSKFNADLEKRFFSESIFRCNNLSEAINWAQKHNE